MMAGARRGEFDIVLVWASDRLARSVKHFLDVLDELNRLRAEMQNQINELKQRVATLEAMPH